MTVTNLDILVVSLFTWSLKVKFLSIVTPRNLTVETFVRIETRILMWNAFFRLEIIIYEVLLTLREVVGLEPIIHSYQFPIHSGKFIFNVTVVFKNCSVVSKMKKTHLMRSTWK